MSMYGNKEKTIFISSVYLKHWNILLLPVFYQKPKNNQRTCLDCRQTREHVVVLPFLTHPRFHAWKS